MEKIAEIIDDIEAGLIDDPIADYQYLKGELAKYENHELAGAIIKAISRMMYIDIPVMARKELKQDMTGDPTAFNMFIAEAQNMMSDGYWRVGIAILENLIGDGIGIKDTDELEFRTMYEEIQNILYDRYFKAENKKVIQLPVDLGRLYGLYGCALIEFNKVEEARGILTYSLHFNPLDLGFCFEYAETFKIQGEYDEYEQLSRKYLEYAYRAADIGRLYRNLGFVYIEKKDFKTAEMLYIYSLAYDPENKNAKQELAYISEQTGVPTKDPTQEEANEALSKESIQRGVSDKVLKPIIQNAYLASQLDHDIEKTKYFCKLIYDVTRNDTLVKEYMGVAADKSKGFGGILGCTQTGGEETPLETLYEQEMKKFMQEVFPEFPEMNDCRMRISFTVGSVKYKDTIFQILSYIDESSKLVDEKEVTLVFADLESAAKYINLINDIVIVAGKWKSFEMTINDVVCDKYAYRYFTDFLCDNFDVKIAWAGTAEEILKKYKRLTAPKRVKKQSLEEGFAVDLDGCTPQEIVTGLASTYANVYLSECNVKVIRVSDDEIVLSANDEFVVDFWVSPYGYGPTMTGQTDGLTPYESCTYIIQELSRNNLFKYNASAFKRIFNDIWLPVESFKFTGPDCYEPRINHFYKIDAAYPELRLKEKAAAYTGEQYTFVVFEMENADGSIGQAIGFTSKKLKPFLVKICKELESRTSSYLDGNSAPGLVFSQSKSFIAAFLSWKGEKKTKRLEQHLRYYTIEKAAKDKYAAEAMARHIMSEVNKGQYKSIERKTYADIGRK